MNTINVGVIRAGAGIDETGLPAVMTNPAIIPDAAVIDLDMKFLPDETSQAYRRDFEEFVRHFEASDRWLRANPIASSTPPAKRLQAKARLASKAPPSRIK